MTGITRGESKIGYEGGELYRREHPGQLVSKKLWHSTTQGIRQVAPEPTLYIETEGGYTPKGEVEKNYLVCYPVWGKKETPVIIG